MIAVILTKSQFVCEWPDGRTVTYDVYLSDAGDLVTLERDDESTFVFDADTWPTVRDKIDEAFGLAGKSGGGLR